MKEIMQPCPFCGSPEVKTEVEDGFHFEQCAQCGATGPVSFKYSEDGDRTWNTRAAAPTPPNPIACHVDESCGQGGGEVEVPDYFVAACDKFDWTPEEALRFYAEGKHFDTVNGRTRILCTGAIASHALKGMGGEYADMKGMDNSPNGVKLEVFEIVCKERDAIKAEVDQLHSEIEKWSGTAVQNGMEVDRLQDENTTLKAEVKRLRAGGQVTKGEIERLEEFKRQVRENRKW